jgi:tRNA(fMet)-specific endonuclease VapC
MPWGRDETVAYGSLRKKLEVSGTPLGSLDTLIAAHAIALDAILATSDKAFARVDNVGVSVNWVTDL